MKKLQVEVRVVTNSKEASVKQEGNWLKVRVKAKPIDGKANEEIVSLLAKHFNVPTNKVKITRGSTSTRKVVEVEN